ncbi:efflux RND transporter permease subunit [Myxosarcina sp. GI1]|uniref:efflux RND transporter permease subunit n=1 Tax=Myxosarcina sp. GI1 TaxID=1541065 RepID=UPI000A58F06F|nr:efflux RND transporter permease subunit [Myxosarcina sp. GI1]
MALFSIATNFIKRPVLTTVCTIVIVLVGGVCIPLLPINYLPDVSPVQIEVSSSYTGADIETVEDTVTTILEEQINGVPGMDYSTSQSYAGTSSISVYFPTGTDKDIAQVNVQNRVAQALPQLPTPVQQLGVTTQAASTSILLIFGVYSEAGAYDSIFISNYVDANITDVLKRINGVGDVTIFGAKQNAMRIWLNPQDLAARGLTALDVAQAVRSQNVVVGAGSIGQEPITGQQEYELPVQIQGRLQDADEFENLVVKTLDSGAVVRLRDVGYAELGAENYGQNASVNGQQGVGIAISQLPGSNALDVGNNVKDAMEELSNNFPPGMVTSLVYDTTEFVQVSIQEVFTTLLQAIALVIIIIFVFLQDWRTTVIPAVAIPVSLIGALGFAFVFGFSLNSLTLFGLILATGLVVDDAIVIVEAITAKIEEGMTPRKASLATMDEIAGAVLSTSVVLMAVFIPVAFFPGTTGILYQQFALIIAFSVAVSTFNALTFTPAMSAILLRSPKQRQSENGKKGFLDKIFTPFNRFLSWIIDRYTAFVKFLIRIRYIVIGLFVLGLFATYMVLKAVPGGFVPPEDQGVMLGIVQAPDGVSLSYTSRVTEFVSETFENTPEIEDYFVASGVGLEGAGPNKGVFFAKLKSWDERDQTVESVIEQLNQKFYVNQDATIAAFNLPPIPGFSSTGGIEMQLQNQSGGSLGIDDFLANAQEIIAQANQSPAVGSAFTQFTASTPQLKVDINRDQLEALNVDFQSALQTIGAFIGSQYINDFTLEGRSYRVYLQAESEYRNSPDDLESLYVQSRVGQMIPLGEIATVSRIVGPQIIYHYNGNRSIKIQGSASEDSSSGRAIAVIDEAVAEASLPGVTGDWIGLAKEELAAGSLGALVFLFGIIMVFLTLSAQYESYIDPLIILLTVPLAILGALSFVALGGLDNNVYVQVALVMLIGLASKNAILIVELANQTRETGVSIVKSAQEAAKERFRPILMTAVSSLVGFFPLVIASGAGSASRRSIGTALVGGLLVSTILSF